ncbi:MAG: EamA family transporter, partial [Anaerolineales bacterium]|nr:EamA family transporter [Anaerolineales bacterium]
GQLTIDSGLASILVSTMPFFTLLLAHFFTDDERLTPPKLLGIGLGLLGIVVLIGPDALSGLGGSIAGQLMVTAAAVSYAIGAILSRSYLRASRQRAVPPQLRALEIVTGQYAATAVLLILLAFTVEDPLALHPSLRSITALLISALPVSLTAVLVYYYLIDAIGASFSALSIYIIPIAGVLMGALLLGEPITPQVIIALVLILLGVAIVNGLFSWRKRPLVHSG